MDPKQQQFIDNGQFIEAFEKMQRRAFEINLANGWWEKRTHIIAICQEEGIDYFPHLAIELLGLMMSECSEGIEAARKNPKETWGDAKKKDTLVREIAGAIVRGKDFCEYFGLPLAEAIIEEIEANSKRGYMHGGKAA